MTHLRLLLTTALLLWSCTDTGARSLRPEVHQTLPAIRPSAIRSTVATTVEAVLAALAVPGRGSAPALKGRRALGDTLLEGAAEALSSQVAAGAQAVASQAGAEAGRATRQFFASLWSPLGASSSPNATLQAATTAAESPDSDKAAAVRGRTFAPAPTPASDPALLSAPATTAMGAFPVAAAHSTALAASAEHEREKAVPGFQLGAFLVEHANLIEPLEGSNGGHVIQAAKLAQQQLRAEASHWLAQLNNQSAKSEPSGIAKLVAEAPRDMADLPNDVAETFTGFGDHISNEALNASYYAEEFDKFLHKLQDPVALQAGASLFSNNPCLFSTNLGAVEASATGVSVSPSLISLSAAGINVSPQAISISPALLSVGATGVNVSPQGLNIAPALIAVTPGRVAVNPQGGTISPVGLSVTAPAEPAKPTLGRRALRQTLFEGLTDAVTSLAAGAEAAANTFLGGTPASVATPNAAPPTPGPAQPATEEVAGGHSAAADSFTLPVALHGLGNWAALVGRMCQSAAGTSSHEESDACLTQYFNRTNAILDSLADKYKDLKGGNISAALGQDFPKLDIKAPTFYSGSNHVMNTNVAGLQLSATGFSFSPCAIPIGPVGISVSATGVTISPTLISASATGVNVQPQGVNIAPDLIVVGPYDTTVAGQGLNIAPALITVSPTRTAINPVGPLKISDAKVTETLPALPSPDERS